MSEIAPGTRFGDYEVEAELGKGGMGRVFRGRHLTLDRPVALKLLNPQFAADESYLARFLKEARAAARLNHPNIVQIYDFGHVGPAYYLAMELVPGRSLGHYLRHGGRFTEADAINTVRHACTALGIAHEAGIVHRDVKPDNFILSDDGAVKLVDLGLAKSLADDQNLTLTGVVAGTPNYISPEQIEGLKEIDGRADIYSLGATLFHLVTGRPPYQGSSPMVIIAKHLHDELPDVDLYRLQQGRAPGSMSAPGAPARPIGSGPAAGGPAPAQPWEPEFLARIEDRLAAAVGPLARVLVRNASRSASDPTALCRELAGHIPSRTGKAAFLEAVEADLGSGPPSASGLGGRPVAAGADPSSPGLTESSAGQAWSGPELEALHRSLAEIIGPVARVLVKTASRKADSWDDLIERLAAGLDSPTDKAAFRRAAARLTS